MFGLSRRPAEEEPPVFDRSYLARLERHVGPDMLRELAADGLFELTDRLNLMEHLATAGDVGGMAVAAHDIASVAGHVGLSRLSLLAVELSRVARAEPGTDPTRLLAPVREARGPALLMLRAFLDERSATSQNRA